MTEPFIPYNQSCLHIAKWQQLNPKLRVGFTTRVGGNSVEQMYSFNQGLHVNDDKAHVLANRKMLADWLEMPLSRWISAEQVHGIKITKVLKSDGGKGAISYNDSLKGVDGMITNVSGILCTAFFADCVPLFFFDPTTNYIGIAHAGWRGTVSGIGREMVNGFMRKGVNVNHLQVVIGPSISQGKYEVDDTIVQHIPVDLHRKVLIDQQNGHFLLDLKQLNVEILLQCGIIRHNIDVSNHCTFQQETLFFSHRRDKGHTGRMLGYIGFEPGE